MLSVRNVPFAAEDSALGFVDVSDILDTHVGIVLVAPADYDCEIRSRKVSRVGDHNVTANEIWSFDWPDEVSDVKVIALLESLKPDSGNWSSSHVSIDSVLNGFRDPVCSIFASR